MPDVFRADGDNWRVTLDEFDRRRAVHTVVFHCVSNTQRPYRVIEVPDEAFGDRDLTSFSKQELTDLFDGSHTMDYSHDRDASPRYHGYGDPPGK
jgi:hypothetical protein